MIHKTFYHRLVSGENAKFTIRERIINGELYYFASVVSIDLQFYKDLSKSDQKAYLGVEVTDGNQKTIVYQDSQKLETDIIMRYGIEWLESEI